MLVACLSATPVHAQAPQTTLRLLSVRMIWDRGEHQAFTDLIRYRDQWVCAFREAPRHDGGIEGSKIVVLTSPDGQAWSLNHEFADPRGDVRDAKLSINPQGELVLLTAMQLFGATSVDDRKYQSIALFTSDLMQWTKPIDVLDDGYWLWGLSWNPVDGCGYSIGYRADYTAHLYRTRDGRSFERIAESFDAVTNKPNESAMVFEGDTAYCLLRAFGPAYIGTARRPFTDWSWKRIDQAVGGPELLRLPDGTLLGAGRLYLPDKVRTTSIFTVDPDRGAIQELLRLPSGGDTSYPGLVWHDNTLFLSYYTSHEGKSRIYFAQVDVAAAKPAASTRGASATPYHLDKPDPSSAGVEPSLLIYLYGAGGSMTNYNLKREPYAQLRAELAQRGYYVVVPELGKLHFMNDAAKAALDQLVDQLLAEHAIPRDRVHIMGTSMGGGSALAYAIHRPDLIRSVCAVMPMTDFAAWIAENPRYAQRVAGAYGGSPQQVPDAYAKTSAIGNVDAFARIPILLIHGQNDPVVRQDHSIRLHEAMQAKGHSCVLRSVATMGHQDAIVQSYQLEIADFLDASVSGVEATAATHGTRP